MTEIAFPLILIENLVKTAHKLKTWCCQRDYVHLSLIVIYISTPSCGFNSSQLVNSLNASKTKVMLFGINTKSIKLEVKINGNQIEQVTQIKYLGVGLMLDPYLSFDLQADYAAGKAKRAAAKVARLYDGRKGVKIQIGIVLYRVISDKVNQVL